jgi:hypothetical protein
VRRTVPGSLRCAQMTAKTNNDREGSRRPRHRCFPSVARKLSRVGTEGASVSRRRIERLSRLRSGSFSLEWRTQESFGMRRGAARIAWLGCLCFGVSFGILVVAHAQVASARPLVDVKAEVEAREQQWWAGLKANDPAAIRDLMGLRFCAQLCGSEYCQGHS